MRWRGGALQRIYGIKNIDNIPAIQRLRFLSGERRTEGMISPGLNIIIICIMFTLYFFQYKILVKGNFERGVE